MECSRCGETAVTRIRYSGEHLCRKHFKEFFETKVFKEFRKQVDLNRGKDIGVAVSGGKDSIVALRMLHKILEERRDSRLYGITIDEGIKGYRPKSLEIAEREYKKLGIDYKISSYEENFGFPLDEMMEYDDIGMPCSVCGVLRRWMMNTMSKEADLDVLATGLNLDDTAQTIMMNFCRADMKSMARLAPHDRVKEGLVPRINPLRKAPEKETYLYALLSDMDVHEQECPYADTALRGLYRDVLGQLEDNTPGVKFSILSSYEKIKDPVREKYEGEGELERCVNCGEPAMNERCKACQILKELEKKR
ncbi:MAG: TIGR00269 family protein [Candidatus Thermoplasmatota archaeon]|nr:TIGR00269 family protein [Candidatus Thermoplasmatota archaeon]MBS3790336.1 TIGR00269 family protein [Candidatus Thermoplasmatota archaeon]